MPVTIGSNLGSLQAQRRLADATDSLTTVYTRLASGLRINKASDDAAGLAVASDLNLKGRVYTQGIRNGNDGLSALSVADAAIESLTGIVVRIRELAAQSANGTYSDQQRKSLDSEAQALRNEYFRIANATSFNGLKLLDGSVGSGVRLQLGFGANGSILAGVGGTIGAGSFGGGGTFAGLASDLVSGDFNGDGITDIASVQASTLSVRFGDGNGGFNSLRTFAIGQDGTSIATGDLNGDGVLDLAIGTDNSVRLFTGSGTGQFSASGQLFLGNTFSIAIADLNRDGIQDIVTLEKTDGAIATTLGIGGGAFSEIVDAIPLSGISSSMALGDVNGDGILDIVAGNDGGSSEILLGLGNGSFNLSGNSMSGMIDASVALADLNGDGKLDLIEGSSVTGSTVSFGDGSGNFASTTILAFQSSGARSEIITADVNGDGRLDIISTNYSGSRLSITINNGNGNFSTTQTINEASDELVIGDFNGDGVTDIGANGLYGNGLRILLGATRDGTAPLLPFSLASRVDARQAMGYLDRTLDNLSKQRGIIGAFQSRIAVGLSTLTSGRENFSAAEARIRDADIAADSATLVRTQILQQAGSAVLSQANVQPQLAIRLLAG